MIYIVKAKEDLTNKKIGNWIVICQAEDYISPNTGKRYAQWLCECDCEKHTRKIIQQGHLKNNESLLCCSYKNKSARKRMKKYNTYDLSGEYGVGYTTKGEEFWFDLEDYDLIKDYCWYKDKDGYFATKTYGTANPMRITMHRLVMGFPDATDIDHIHGKETRYDNRKSNLRTATHSQNNMNKGLQINNSSGITGISWFAKTNQWRAYIIINKKFVHLGLYDNLEDAIKARKEAENKYFGEFSYDNSINK